MALRCCKVPPCKAFCGGVVIDCKGGGFGPEGWGFWAGGSDVLCRGWGGGWLGAGGDADYFYDKDDNAQNNASSYQYRLGGFFVIKPPLTNFGSVDR